MTTSGARGVRAPAARGAPEPGRPVAAQPALQPGTPQPSQASARTYPPSVRWVAGSLPPVRREALASRRTDGPAPIAKGRIGRLRPCQKALRRAGARGASSNRQQRPVVTTGSVPPGSVPAATGSPKGVPARGPAIRVPRWQRSGGPRRLCRQRDHLDLPDHARLRHGRALRRLVGRRAAEPVGRRARRHRDAVRGRCRRRPPRRAPEGRPGNDLHRLAGPAADDPEHVQDRRRADADGDPRRRPDARHPCAVDLRRPQRRHARAGDRLGDARRRLGPGGARLRAGGPCRNAPQPGAVPPLLRRLPDLARDRQDRGPRAGTTSAR